MTDQKPTTARFVAADLLNHFDPKRNYAAEILNKLLPKTDQKQRATDLVFGVIRNRHAIDTVIARFAECPAERIPAKLLSIIRIAAFELIYSPATPQYSIVNEAVENTKTIAGKKQTGFVNAVLRQIARHITNRQANLTETNPTATLPQIPSTGCEFDTAFLPDLEVSPPEYLSTAFSLPEWLVIDWLNEFGLDQTRQICFASNRRPSIYLRPNKLKTTTEQLTQKLRQANIDPEIVPPDIPRGTGIKTQEAGMLRIKSPRTITELPGFTEGLFTVQDIAASLPVRFLQPQPDWDILDLCAAPGVKTTQLAELIGDKAKIIATDINTERLKKVRENITRLGLKNITVIEYEKLLGNAKFDAVLLDVPCSNTGVLARRVETRYRITPAKIMQLTRTQAELLKTASTIIKPKGRIAYSTCSIQKPENSKLIEDFLQKNPDLKLESQLLIIPSAGEFDHDGGYVAIIKHR